MSSECLIVWMYPFYLAMTYTVNTSWYFKRVDCVRHFRINHSWLLVSIFSALDWYCTSVGSCRSQRIAGTSHWAVDRIRHNTEEINFDKQISTASHLPWSRNSWNSTNRLQIAQGHKTSRPILFRFSQCEAESKPGFVILIQRGYHADWL